ncbi:unnamed protein product [Symbiodinium necroappetens]|uniref:Uncharacterized protein n=1 Tax=Symbiodinium necroappetens TaxID=1628268 RepID=A0A812JW15_9DINO|nr:unnamed protein product [Symbiodinium necroappetens]
MLIICFQQWSAPANETKQIGQGTKCTSSQCWKLHSWDSVLMETVRCCLLARMLSLDVMLLGHAWLDKFSVERLDDVRVCASRRLWRPGIEALQKAISRMDVEADISEDITDIGDVSAQCAAQCLEVEAPKPYDQELYQLLSHAAECGDLDGLLTITDTHLTELSSINAAFALIHAARMLQVGSPKRDDALHSPKLVNLIRHVENIVMGHRLEGAVVAETGESEDSSSEVMKVEDQGLHMAWTVSVICWGLGLLGHKNDKLLSCLARMVKPLLPHLSPHQLQNCLWAFASLEMKDSGPFFGAAVEIIEPRIALFSHEHLGRMQQGQHRSLRRRLYL